MLIIIYVDLSMRFSCLDISNKNKIFLFLLVFGKANNVK